jgi:CheY-like chemotaxis protein
MTAFTLVGHDSPLEQYPSLVLPVGHRPDGRLFVVYQGAPGKQEDPISDQSRFVRYSKELLYQLRFFDPGTHQLFAYSETDVKFFAKAEEAYFFDDFLSDGTYADMDPFIRLSFAKLTRNPQRVIPEIGGCLLHLRETPTFLRSWCAMEVKQLLQSLGFQPSSQVAAVLDLRKKVLVVEDVPAVANALMSHLESKGYAVSIAPDGVRGLALALDLHPDLIVLDLRLPHMDGYAVLRQLRLDDDIKHIPTVILSAYIDDWETRPEEFRDIPVIAGPVGSFSDLEALLRKSQSRQAFVSPETTKRIFLPKPIDMSMMDEVVQCLIA